MIAVLFEVTPADGKMDQYLKIAAELREELSKISGFISIERFQSLIHPKKILSLSFWENEEAIEKWRNIEIHRQAQSTSRESLFSDYRLRVGMIVRDYGISERLEAPKDSNMFHMKK